MRPWAAAAFALTAFAVAAVGAGGADEATPIAVAKAGSDRALAKSRAEGSKVLTDGLSIPWGLDFLPNRAALVSERSSGDILRIPKDGGRAKRVMRVPGVDRNAGEGGLLGIALSPDYRRDGLVFAYLTTKRDNRIVRFKLGERPKPILTGIERSTIHNGGRIAFGPDGLLYAGVGDAADTSNSQDSGSPNGKILRINRKGGVPKSNPFPGSPVYSLGHRNVQGLAWDRKDRLWATEFGQDRRDEVNLIKPGKNYGWPIVEGKGDTQGGKFTNPQVTWSPAQSSPSGAAILGSTLYVAALQGERLWQIPLKGKRAGKPKATLKGRFGRLRTVEVAPDRSLWITTSNDDRGGGPDKVVRLRP